jgi:hypothetical protein
MSFFNYTFNNWKNTPDGVFDRYTRLVQQLGKSLHLIRDEIVRWRKILEEPYNVNSVRQLSLSVTLVLPVVPVAPFV